MAIIGSASVQIRALDNLFQGDVKKAVEKIKDVTINFVAEFKDTEAKKKIDELRRKVEAEHVNIRATADTQPAEKDLSHLHKKFDGKNVKLDANAATTGANQQLNWVSRDRTSKIYPLVDAGSFATAKAMLESLSGINTLRTFKDMLKEMATGFDTASLKALTLSSAVLGLVDSIGWLASAAFGAGEGIAQLVGFFAMAPTLIGALTSILVVNHLAWDNFGAAMSSNVTTATKALAQLPPNAREAAIEVKKLWEDVKKPIQDAFWIGMDKSLQDTFRAMAPVLKDGLSSVAQSMGRFTKQFLLSFKQIADNGTIGEMFSNLNLAIDALGRGVGPLFDALNKLGFVGSKYLPQLGNWLSDLSVRFDNFISKAVANGDVDRWLNNAKAALNDIWRIGDGVIGIFQGLTRAFREAGGGGLDQMATSLKNVEDIIKGPVFQSQFGQIFSGMLKGAHAVKEGIADVGKALGNTSQVIGSIFQLAGGAVKEMLDGIGALVSVKEFQVGLVTAFGAYKNAINDLQPAFKNLGGIIGDFLEISGKIFSQITPVINDALSLIKNVVDNLKGGFLDVIPVLMHFVDTLIIAFSGPITAVAKIIGDLLTGFSKLPSGITTAIIAIGLAAIAARKLGDAFSKMRDGMKEARKDGEKAKEGYVWLNKVQDWAGSANKALGKSFDGLREGLGTSLEKAKTAAGDFRAAGIMAATDFGNGIKSAFGATGFVGAAIGEAIGKSFSQAAGAVGRAASSIGDAISTGVQKATGAVGQAIGNMGTAIRRATGPLVFTVQQFASDMRDGFVSAFSSMDSVRDGFRNIGASISNFKDSVVSGVQGAFQKVGDVISALPGKAKAVFDNLVASTHEPRRQLGFLWDDLVASTIYMDKRLRDIGTSFATAGKDIAGGLKGVAEQVSQTFSFASAGATVARNDIVGGFKAVGQQVGDALSYASALFEPFTRTASNIGTSVAKGVKTAVETVRDVTSAAAQNISGNFAPVGAAFGALGSSISEGMGNARIHLENIGTGFGNLVSSAGPAVKAIGGVTKAVGSAVAGGLGMAVNGLMGALGGPWGIAIAGATTVLSLFGQAQDEAKARVENLSSTLDKQTGAVTAQTTKNIAEMLAKKPDKFLAIFDNGDSALDNAKKFKLSSELVSKAIAGDPASRTQFLKWQDDFKTAFAGGTEAWNAYTKANDLGNISSEDANQIFGELDVVYQKYKKDLDESQKVIRDVADATGTNTVQAAILAANYETLSSKTSSASDKFNALKANLDVLNGKQLTATNATKSYQQTLADSGKAIEEIKKQNGGLVKNLVDVSGQFDFTKQAGRDFHTVLEGESDSILKLGTSALDSALKNGKKAGDAQQAAMDAMAPAVAQLRQRLSDMGLEVPQIDAIIQSFGLMPKDLKLAMSVPDKEKVIQDIALVKLAAAGFATGNYNATLGALPENAKKAIEDTFNLAGAFAKGDSEGGYTAILKALDSTAGGREAALAQILTFTGGDYKALLRGLNGVDPAIQDARNLITAELTTPDWKARLTAALDSGSVSQVNWALEQLANPRLVTFKVTYDDSARDTAMADRARGRFGGVVMPGKSVFDGPFPMEAFANGGFHSHVAQINRPQGPIRVWGERETGGEAYIPLGLSKRPRSEKILELVARQFGFGLVEMFAEGGFSNTITRRPPTQPQLPTPHISRTNGPLVAVYPSAAMDEEKIGTVAARELWFQIQNR